MALWNGFKKTSVFCLIFLFMPSGLMAKVTVKKNAHSTVYHFEIEKVIESIVELDGERFLQLTLAGVEKYRGIFYSRGEPEIPVVRLMVSASNKEDIEVAFKVPKSGKIASQNARLPLMPSQESIPKIEGFQVDFFRNQASYEVSAYMPLDDYKIEDAGSIRGVPQKLITVFPLKYNPLEGKYRPKKSFRITVKNYKSGPNRSFSFAKGDVQRDSFAFIIGKRYQDSPSLKRYVSFKETQGFQVIPVVVDSGSERDDAIRRRLREIYHSQEYNLKYALIIGDVEDVPSHSASHLNKGVTDHYYRAVDMEQYQYDVNGPDIGVGRLTVKNEQELKQVIDKLIKYQRGRFADDEWLKKAAFIATNDRWQIAEGTHNFVVENFTVPAGYSGVFPNDPMPGGDKLYAITHKVTDRQVLDTLKLGRAIINYSGHGSTSSWMGPHLHQDNIQELGDGDVLPFVVSNACITGQFIVDESFAETWLKHPAGAVAFWGSMDNTYWTEDDILEKEMYNGIFNKKLSDISSLTQNALSAVWAHYGGENRSKYYWETYHIFGDPSLELRTAKSRAVLIKGQKIIPYGVPAMKYFVVDLEGNPVTDAKVTLASAEGRVIDFGITNEIGSVEMDLSVFRENDEGIITVHGKNLRMTEEKIKVVESDYPYYVLLDFQFNGLGTPNVFPKDEVTVTFSVKNLTQFPSKGGVVTIMELSGPAEAIVDEVEIPALAPFEVLTSKDLSLKIGIKDASEGEAIDIKFKWANKEGQEHVIHKRLKVVRGEVEVVRVDYGDPANISATGIPSGQDGEIFLTVKNVGSAPVNKAVLESITGKCIDSIDNTIDIEKLMPGEVLRIGTPIDVQLNDHCRNGEQALFNLSGSYLNGNGKNLLALSAKGTFTVGRRGEALVEEHLEIPIKDNSTIRHTVKISGIDFLLNISVHLKIKHSFIGDLTVFLKHRPTGKKVKLQKRHGNGESGLDRIYGHNGLPIENVDVLRGLNPSGEWELGITDHAGGDEGVFKYLKFTVTGYQ